MRAHRGPFAPLAAALALALALAASACDRRIEPFDPNEKVATPDLAKIFPPGAERAPQDAQMAVRGAPPPGAPMGGPPGMGGMGGGPGMGGRGMASAGAGDAGAEAATGPPIRGRVVVAPELAGRVPSGAVLFLVARTSDAGPPTAVKRVVDPSFPLDFEIGPEDRMMQGIPFAGPFQLTARLDADRNAATRNPGDLQGESHERVPAGARGVEIVIDKVL